MRCSSCGIENRKSAKFCAGCGTVLVDIACAECGTAISPTAKFCDSCGTAVATQSVPSANVSTGDRVASSTSPDQPANRRQMSLLCCDLVESTALARRMDPEDLRYAVTNFHRISKEIIDHYEGYYAQYMGDGFMAYFSYPVAHEDDAYRAVLTGLEIVDEIARFNIELKQRHDFELKLRVGVNTGQVVVDEFVVGEPPNIAARVQAAGIPNAVVITEMTKQLLPPGAFDYEDLGTRELKNVGPLHLFRVLDRAERRDIAVESRVSRPLIGRKKQLDLLSEHWDLVKEGNGQVVIVSGEAGIGKTKLVQGFEALFGAEAHASLRFNGSPFHRNTMLHPVIENIQFAARIRSTDSDDEKLSKLRALLGPFTNGKDMLPLAGRLLSIPEQHGGPHIAPQRLLQQTLDGLIEIVLQYASRGPTLLVFEDVHWFDPTTTSLIERLIPFVGNEPVFVLLTTRSSFTPQLQEKHYLTQIALPRLRSSEADDLIRAVVGDKVLPREVNTQITAKANGVPLYVEELTKMVLDANVLESAGDPIDLISLLGSAIPLTLRDPLTSRVDRVKGRRVLQLAAILGRTFDFQLLLSASSLDADVLSRELQHLVDAELLYQKGTVLRTAVFEFKHALICDAAYNLLTKAERESYHKKVGQLLEESFSERAKAHPEIVAYHYTQARSYEKALHYWYEAGKHSALRSAHNEAVGHLKQGLKLLPNIDNPKLRTKSELLLQTSLGNSLRVAKGWSTEEAKQAYTRAFQLCKESGFDEHTIPVLFGLHSWNFVRSFLDEAQALSELLLNTAGNMSDPAYKVIAHQALGFTRFAQGNFSAAHQSLECSMSLCEDSKIAQYLHLSGGQDPRIHVRLYDGMTLWQLGYPDRALRMCTEASARVDASYHPFSEALARTISLRVYQFRGDAAAVAKHADAAVAVSEAHEFVHYIAMSLILRGWALASQGEFEKGIIEMQEGLEKQRAAGALLFETYALGLLADACIRNERYGQAFDFLRQAELRLEAERGSERFYASEIYRLFGEAYRQSGKDTTRAEQYFQKGLAVAREQGARSFELRLLSSACDLEESPNIDSYRRQLADLYLSFSEGFDTADLVKASERCRTLTAAKSSA
jgi:class 3 adenylate cyclase/tetratricopeptide (TPR) repeat protein